jgi:hypothetical protein
MCALFSLLSLLSLFLFVFSQFLFFSKYKGIFSSRIVTAKRPMISLQSSSPWTSTSVLLSLSLLSLIFNNYFTHTLSLPYRSIAFSNRGDGDCLLPLYAETLLHCLCHRYLSLFILSLYLSLSLSPSLSLSLSLMVIRAQETRD